VTPAVTHEQTRVVRERQFSLDGGDEAVLRALSHLRGEHVTGPLTIHLACGGVCAISFHEEQKITFDTVDAEST
jgi:hypothetical protein